MNAFIQAQASNAPLNLDASDDFGAVGAWLREVGYTRAGLHAATRVLGLESSANLNPVEVERRLPTSGPLRHLLRLFRLGHTLTDAEIDMAFQPLGLPRILALGLVVRVEDGYRSPFTLQIHEELYVLGDQPSETPSANHVIRLNPSAVVTAAITPRQPVKRALDLGTGNGIQALLAARHAEHVIATDINARALNVAAGNAQLNGMHNIEFRLGSWFEPVGHETFDLIVSNPPFVISPRSTFVYRDSGQAGDEICRMVAQDAADRLTEGGYGVLLGNWPFEPGGDWAAEPKRWLDNRQVDALALLSTQADPLGYTIHWQAKEHDSVAGLARTTDEWLTYFAQRGINAIATGSLIFRKRTGSSHYFTGYDIPNVQASPTIGQHLESLFAAHDRVRAIQNLADWQAIRFRPRADLRIEQTLAVTDHGFDVVGSRVRQTQGLGFTSELNPMTQAMLDLSWSGQHEFGTIVQTLAQRHEVDPDRLVGPCLETLQRWLLQGIVEPVGA